MQLQSRWRVTGDRLCRWLCLLLQLSFLKTLEEAESTWRRLQWRCLPSISSFCCSYLWMGWYCLNLWMRVVMCTALVSNWLISGLRGISSSHKKSEFWGVKSWLCPHCWISLDIAKTWYFFLCFKNILEYVPRMRLALNHIHDGPVLNIFWYDPELSMVCHWLRKRWLLIWTRKVDYAKHLKWYLGISLLITICQ